MLAFGVNLLQAAPAGSTGLVEEEHIPEDRNCQC